MATVRAVITGALRRLSVVGGVGRRSPSNQEFADALVTMLAMYRGLITSGAFGRMRDIVPRGDYVCGENQRVYRRYNDAQSIVLPDMVSYDGLFGYLGTPPTYYDQATSLDGSVDALDPIVPSTDYGCKPWGLWSLSSPCQRTIRDGAVVTIVDEMSGDILEALYDGQRKGWFLLSDLDTGEELDETNPYSLDRLNTALDAGAPISHRDLNGLIAFMATLLADEFAADIPAMTMVQAQQFKRNLVANYSNFKRDDINAILE